tara:strand:- start:136 stop:312 length:177 start_codon:yes stop_codon:yes gene_type:complete
MNEDGKSYKVLIENRCEIKVFKIFKDKTNAEHWRDVFSLYNPYRRTWIEEVEEAHKPI